MKNLMRISAGIMSIALLAILISFTVPDDWIKKGTAPEKYEAGVDKSAGRGGMNAGTIKSIATDIDGNKDFGSLAQNINPSKYLGKKIKFTGFIKCKDVAGWAGLWMRIDEQKKYSLENMKDRFVRGNSDWKKCEIILEVPTDTKNIAFGSLLYGAGQIWFDNLKIAEAGRGEKTTGELEGGNYDYQAPAIQNSEPKNLDFSK